MSKIIDKIFGTHSDREVKLVMPYVKKILSLRDEFIKLSDNELKHKTVEFKERIKNGETLDDILPEAFATVREASRRVIGLEHYEVQLIGGIILYQGRIAEMKTGEGKTLVSTCPAYLVSLLGKGVCIVTVNEYLAKRDCEWMGEVHRFLGQSCEVVLNEMDATARQNAYNADITYVTNNELGFDYLRDNMAIYKNQQVLRGLNYCIIDEVDSVLIDEARTPLIISGQSSKSTKLYETCDILSKQLIKGTYRPELNKLDVIMGETQEEDGDYVVNEKDKQVILTEQGIHKVEQFFGIDNLSSPNNIDIQHNVILSLRAHNLMHRDKDYIVKDDEIIIVDEFTGRLMPGRRYSDGLHQAIEAKEHVKIKRESKTLATITFQNFFNKFTKKAGMTGTAQTEEKEFRTIYGMDVIVIPTNVPVKRVDHNDAVYKTKREKFNAVVNEIAETYKTGQPVLVGTINIDTSEMLSDALRKIGIPHNVLNAKQHEREAQIVADAGLKGMVTIATNMAGRGTDIKLTDETRALGGLKIIGTERHESRRIDNQLRGRSGRQGDPGESRFYISLEDDLMRLFGSENLINLFNSIGVADGEQIEHKMLTNAIEKAQKRIENNNFSIRENLLKYDDINNEQREVIYEERNKVLNGENLHNLILKMIKDVITNIVNINYSNPFNIEKLTSIYDSIFQIIPIKEINTSEFLNYDITTMIDKFYELALKLYDDREKELFPDNEQAREIERVVLLRVIDTKWMNHIDDMDVLRQGINLQAFGHKDPLVEYKIAAYEMFDALVSAIKEDTIKIIYHLKIAEKVERKEVAKPIGTNRSDEVTRGPKVNNSKKVYPNDPCPCGSGKKYKNCCGKNA